MLVDETVSLHNEKFLKGSVYQQMKNAFESPITSHLLDICSVNELSTNLFLIRAEEVQCKCVSNIFIVPF